MTWLKALKALVEKKPLVIIRFDRKEWSALLDSRNGVNEFTLARAHALFEDVRTPSACIVVGTGSGSDPEIEDFIGDGNDDNAQSLYFGLISSISGVTTFQTRIKVRRCVRIKPDSETELVRLLSSKRYARNLAQRLRSADSIIRLSPKLRGHVIDRLASISKNHGALRAVGESLSSPKKFSGAASLQEDAVRMALRAIGLTTEDRASSLQLVKGQDTAPARVGIMEDSVIEHDARSVPPARKFCLKSFARSAYPRSKLT
jgi:hypothetical protein